jgi:SAM-dependent methyltransferase
VATGELRPPEELITKVLGEVGPRVFDETGQNRLRTLIERCDLAADHSVLDVGCGIGRHAIPLSGYLNANGSYEGFDLISSAIEWCSADISSRYPNFRFQLLDVHNKAYNPTGKLDPRDLAFPYEEARFDVVLLASVFTHLLPAAVENYLSEIARVLKVGGRVLATFFLLNEESLGLLQQGRNRLREYDRLVQPGHDFGNYRTIFPENPEQMLAYDEEFVRKLCRERSLRVEEPIHFGSWAGRPRGRGPDWQDVVVAVREHR